MANIGNYINTGLLPLQLRKNIDKMFNSSLEKAADEVGSIFKTMDPVSSNRYTRAEIAGFGLPTQIGEGGTAEYDTPSEGFEKSYFFKEYGMAYAVTEWMLEDEQEGRILQMPQAMAKSIMVFKNYDAFDLLNNGELTTLKYQCKDGGAIFAEHTLLDKRFGSGSTITNKTSSSTSLSETSLDAAFTYYDGMRDENGYPMSMTPDQLIVGEGNRRVAYALMNQMYGGGNDTGLGYWGSTAPTSGVTAGRTNLNMVNSANGGVSKYSIFVSRYLDAGRWFLKAPEHEMYLMWKRAPKQESWFDKNTHNTIYQTRFRYVPFVEDYRGIYGNPYST